jgi:hypothetical protein
MMLLTGLSVALALSVMTTNNFYADKVTNASINQFNNQVSNYAENNIISSPLNTINNIGNKMRNANSSYIPH